MQDKTISVGRKFLEKLLKNLEDIEARILPIKRQVNWREAEQGLFSLTEKDELFYEPQKQLKKLLV